MPVVPPADAGGAFALFPGHAVAALHEELAVERRAVRPPGVEPRAAEDAVERLLLSRGEEPRLQQLLDDRGVADGKPVEAVVAQIVEPGKVRLIDEFAARDDRRPGAGEEEEGPREGRAVGEEFVLERNADEVVRLSLPVDARKIDELHALRGIFLVPEHLRVVRERRTQDAPVGELDLEKLFPRREDRALRPAELGHGDGIGKSAAALVENDLQVAGPYRELACHDIFPFAWFCV